MERGIAKTEELTKVAFDTNIPAEEILNKDVVAGIQVVDEQFVTREILLHFIVRQTARGGGYICMSSNSIHSAVKTENYVGMVKAIRDYRKYPALDLHSGGV